MDASELARSSLSNATTYEEIGEFWDTHSLADYEDVLKEVDLEYTGPVQARVARYLWQGISAEAKRQGVQPETLVNLWLMERLAGESSSIAPDEQSNPVIKRAAAMQEEVTMLSEEKAEYRTESES